MADTTNMQDDMDIIITGDLIKDEDRALEVVINHQKADGKTVFAMSDTLVRVDTNAEGSPKLSRITPTGMKNIISTAGTVYKLKKARVDGENVLVPYKTYPPDDLVQGILDNGNTIHKFPPIEALISTPIIRKDGTLLTTPGYDASSRLYHAVSPDLKGMEIPENPTKDDAKQAAQKLLKLYAEFPFESEADRANTMSYTLQPWIRHCSRGDMPATLIDATSTGSSAGKGLIARSQSLIAYKTTPSIAHYSPDDEEMDKRMLTFILAGAQSIVFDNIKVKVDSAVLEGYLTGGGKYSGRALGTNKSIDAPNKATITLTGNGTKLSKDMARRCIRIRLVPLHAHQDQQVFALDLEQYIPEHRKELVAAVLTMIRAWFAAGKPAAKQTRTINSTFKDYISVMAGVLEYAGVQGFMGNIDQLYEDAYVEGKEWTDFLSEWYSVYGTKKVRTRDIVDYILAHEDGSLANTMPGPLKEEFAKFSYLQGEQARKKISPKFAKAIEDKVMAAHGTLALRINQGGKDRDKYTLWYVNTTQDRADMRIVADSSPAALVNTNLKNLSPSGDNCTTGEGGLDYPQLSATENENIPSDGSASNFDDEEYLAELKKLSAPYPHFLEEDGEEHTSNENKSSADSALKSADSGEEISSKKRRIPSRVFEGMPQYNVGVSPDNVSNGHKSP